MTHCFSQSLRLFALSLLLGGSQISSGSPKGAVILSQLTSQVPFADLQKAIASLVFVNVDRADVDGLGELLINANVRIGENQADTELRSELGEALGKACAKLAEPELKLHCAATLTRALREGSASYARGVAAGLIGILDHQAYTLLNPLLESDDISDLTKRDIFEELRGSNHFFAQTIPAETKLLKSEILAELRLEILIYRDGRSGRRLLELFQFTSFLQREDCTMALRGQAVKYLASHPAGVYPLLAELLETQLAHNWTPADAKAAAALWLKHNAGSPSALAQKLAAEACRIEISGS